MLIRAFLLEDLYAKFQKLLYNYIVITKSYLRLALKNFCMLKYNKFCFIQILEYVNMHYFF